MGSNYIASDATINPSIRCIHDSTTGYAADFSKNGEVDGWEYFDGIHTYGAWGGFLFGTIFEQEPVTYGTVGRFNVFRAVNATTHYFIRIVMKYNPIARDERGIHPLPTKGKIQWRSLQAPIWDDTDKSFLFDIEADNNWHTYVINMGVAQYWQGDINDLRIWPAVSDAFDGDEFFIRAIDIFSSESHECRNTACEKFDEYSFPCPWTGKNATSESTQHADNKVFDIAPLSPLVVDINGYGDEIVKIKELRSATGRELANHLAKSISRINIGGYAEVRVDYTDDNTFKIYSGTLHEDSSVRVIDNDLARYLKFYASNGDDIATYTSGETPVNGYSPLSSFKIKTHQALGLLDNDERTAITFNPFQYSVEGGRRDWLSSSTGITTTAVGANDSDFSGQPIRSYFFVENWGRTLIDYNHPFNASGRITKLWLQCTLDSPNYVKTEQETGIGDPPPPGTRKGDELSGARVMIVRPKRDGTLQVIYEFDVNDRNPARSYDTELYAVTQESIDLDVDIFVNKGDMIAAYNVNLYIGKSVSGHEVDAQYYQISGKPEVGEIFNPGRLYGDGSAGLLVYAHGEDPQRRLYLDIDLGARYNIDNIEVKGEALNSVLEYNIARCLDINWKCDLFGLSHLTHHKRIDLPGDFWYVRANTYYGLDNLNDGVYNVPDGLACDNFSITFDLSGLNWNDPAGPGIVPINPNYFWVNGDEEWLAVWLHATATHSHQSVHEFDADPMAIYLHFPYEKEKKIYKSKIYFKEKFNCRSFAMSTYGGFFYLQGDADDHRYDLIPEYTKITLDNVEYYDGSPTYDHVKDYLFHNPCFGNPILVPTTKVQYEWDPVYSELIEDFSPRSDYGQESGYFTTQSFTMVNTVSYTTSNRVDWQILEHEWDPISCKGWRFYCDFHKSTKITEMELYGVAEDIGSNLSGGIVMTFSDYQEIWWPTEAVQKTAENVEIYIGDSPRYFTLELIPITETRYDDVVFNVKTEDLYAGNKGCEYVLFTEQAKTAQDNQGQLMSVKNVYDAPYDLTIDISPGKLFQSGLLFYSPLNSAASVVNPSIGADSRYYKLDNYPFRNQDYNCAINCHTFGLNNLIDGAAAYYSHNDMLNWSEHEELNHGESINFNNLPTSSRTVVVLPHLSRSRYWKFGLIDPDITMNVREMRVYDNYGNLLDPEFYHDADVAWEEGPVAERAPHLENISVIGSYYQLKGNHYITMDLGSSKALGRIELWHDQRSDYINFSRIVTPYSGIDRYTRMCLRAWKDNTGAYLQDASYYEHTVQLHGSAHIDTGVDDSNVSLDLDLGCVTSLTEWAQRTNYSWPVDYTPEGTWFTPVSASGTVISGSCEFPGYVDFNVHCHNVGNNGYYYDIREDSVEAYKLFQQMPFEITFAIKLTDHYPGGQDGLGGTYTDLPGTVCVGAINSRRRVSDSNRFFAGAQMWFDPQMGRFGLAVRRNLPFRGDSVDVTSPAAYTSTYTDGLSLSTKYYCKFTCYGGDNAHRDIDEILYRAEVWTDAVDGANQIVNITINTNYYWEANEVAVVGGALDALIQYQANTNPAIYGPATVKGTVYDLKLHVDHDVKHHPFRDDEISENEKCSIRIPDGTGNYVQVKNSSELDVRNRFHTHDFWVKFRSLPAVGQRYTIMEQYDYDTLNGEKIGWRLALYNGDSYYRWEWWVNKGQANGYEWSLEEYNGQLGSQFYVNHFNIVKDKWYFMVFSTGLQNGGSGFNRYAFFDIDGRAVFNDSQVVSPANLYDMPAGSDIFIGKDFDGWICEPRTSRGYNDLIADGGGERYASVVMGYGAQWQTPVRTYERMYPFSFWVSDNNQFYGHYANVDAMFPVDNIIYLPYLYYNADNEFAEKYNSYFAIDLGHRYDIDLVRRYGSKDDQLIDIAANIIYSNVDTDDPDEAFMSTPTYDTDDAFYGFGGEFIDKERWRILDSAVGNEAGYLKMEFGRLEHRADSNLTDVRFYSNYGFRGDFDIQVKLGRISAANTNNWYAQFRIDMSNQVRSDYNDDTSAETYVRAMLYYDNGYKLHFRFADGNTITDSSITTTGDDHGFRIIRENDHFFIKNYEGSSWVEGDDRPIYDAKGKDVLRVHFAVVVTTNNPTARIYWKDFKVNYADKIVLRSTNNDARWMAIELLNGDSTSRYINKLGVYPDITNFVCPDNFNYNTSWIDLGPSITAYSTGNNVALDKTVTASSNIGEYFPENVVNGVVDNDRSNAWLSDNTSQQWVLIDLGEQKQVYRVKVYHGYSENDSEFIVQSYDIESSTDGVSFVNRWTITGNSSFERTHDVANPFIAQYIRLYINGYKADNSFRIKELDGINFYDWKGACLREIEVYEYYGYSYISSEEWPIVAVNLRDQFYLQGHVVVGLYAEDTITDWSNDTANFAWSDSVQQDPKKVSFSEFGSPFDYEQWVVIKRDTATYYNITPTPIGEPPSPYGVDYLKHVIIKSTTKENPVNYPWWWSSTLSTVSRDYSIPVSMSISSLKIEYPASTALDTVQFIEGSNWGVDSDFSFRDGVFFRLYIEDADKLDIEDGYFFFGGLDGTTTAQPVVYKWYFSTLSGGGALETGWNSPLLRLKTADEVIYNLAASPLDAIRPEMPEYTQWQTFGVTFKGKGGPVTMNIEGFHMKRNHFDDSSKFDYGLYLAGSDYLDCPMSELDLKAGTVEFWLRPDYTFAGLDIHRRFKNRSLFHMTNVANDVFGFMINSSGFNLYYGNLAMDMRAMLVSGIIAGAIDGMFHIAVAFSSNGKNLAGDNSSIKLYINGGLVATNYDTWDYTDEKLWKFTLGGKAPLALVEYSSSLETTSVDGVISDLRIYNYCKSDFTDSMNNTFAETGVDLVTPSKMIEISQDNVTYYKIGDWELPFFYEKVPAGNTVQVYVKSVIPNGLTGKEDRTAGIITSWNIGV